MLYAIESTTTNEVLAVCPDRETADFIAARLGGRTAVYAVGSGGAVRALVEKPHAVTEWVKSRRAPRQSKLDELIDGYSDIYRELETKGF